MDAAKPSSEGNPKTTANEPGTAAPRPAEGTAASAAKRPEQMFVVQKSGPVPAGPGAPNAAGQDAAAQKNAFQNAITQGAGARVGASNPGQPAGAQASSGQTGGRPPAGQGQPAPTGAHSGPVQAMRPQPSAAGGANV